MPCQNYPLSFLASVRINILQYLRILLILTMTKNEIEGSFDMATNLLQAKMVFKGIELTSLDKAYNK